MVMTRPKSIKAFITPNMLRWARNRSAETADSVARKVSVSPTRYESWESGDDLPTMKQAQNLAKKLKVPLGYLYLTEPPNEDIPLPDLRTFRGEPHRPSPDFIDVLYDALRKQEWYRQNAVEQANTPLEFIGQFDMNSSPEEVATSIRNVLQVTDDAIPSDNWEQYLKDLIIRAEDSGILILRSGYVGNSNHRPLNREEFQGFAISDPYAPLIFINQKDFIAAQTFTLAHELAHLWVGESGISSIDYRQTSEQQDNAVERHCDRIAAEVLVPANGFLSNWLRGGKTRDNIDRLARRYRVSSFVILRRALELGEINRSVFETNYDNLISRISAGSRSEGSGGNYYSTAMVRNSRRFTTTVIAAVLEDRVLPTEAAALLNVRVAKLRNFENHVLS